MIYRNDYINRNYRNQKYYRQETIIMRGNKIMGFVWIILAVCLLGILLYKINFSSHAGPRGRLGMGGENNLLLSTNGGDGPVFLPGSYKLVESKQFDASEIDSFDFNITRETLWVQQVDDKKYTVELYCPEEWKASIKVPKNEELDDIDITHTSGGNHLEGIKFNTIDMNSMSGSVHLNNCSGKKAEVNSNSGSIHISRNTYDEFMVSSTSGSVHIDDSVAKRLSVDSTSGSLKINGKYNAFALHAISGSIRMEDSISPDSNCEISAVSGSIYLNLPKQSGFNVNYDLGSGSYHNHLTGLDGKKGSETVNAGGPTIYVKANSGSVHVNKN